MDIGNYEFKGPWLLGEVDFINQAAVYVVLDYRQPSYHMLYVGETGQLGTRLSTHERFRCWQDNASGQLYVALLWTPSDLYTDVRRRAIEKISS